MITSQRDMILSSVNQATDSSALINLIPFLPLHSLQTCAKQYIEDASQSAINKIYHNVIPLDQIIPPDVIQKILSFNPLSIAQQGVSKLFKELSNTNHLNQITQRNKVIQHPKFNFDIDFQTGTHWIVYPKRQQLTCDDRALEHKEALDLEETFEQCQNEDVLLLYDGQHTIYNTLFCSDKDLSLIGVGDNVVITIIDNDPNVYLARKRHLKNVKVARDISISYFVIGEHGYLWMEQCKSDMGIHVVGTPSFLYVKNCQFKNMLFKNMLFKNIQQHAINISVDIQEYAGEVMIVGSTFTGWGHLDNAKDQLFQEIPCICIETYFDTNWRDNQHKTNEIIIVGNIFSNNKGRSIVFQSMGIDGSQRIKGVEAFLESRVLVHSNISQNKNGTLKDQISPFQKHDPNQIDLVWFSNEETESGPPAKITHYQYSKRYPMGLIRLSQTSHDFV
eukprot:341852_1